MTDSFIDDDYILAVLLYQASDIMAKIRDRELAPYGLTSTQSAVLFAVKDMGDRATPAEISRRLMREPQSVTTLLERMEKRGLINRVKNVRSGNLTTVTLTERGQQAFLDATKREAMHQIMSTLSKAEHAQLRENLKKLRDQTLSYMAMGMTPSFP